MPTTWRDFESRLSEGGDGHERHLKNIFCGALTLGSPKVRIYERTFSRQKLISKLPLRWWPKASPKVVSEVFSETGFTKRGLKFGISEGTFKKFSEPGLTFDPPHFRISESFFQPHLDNWIPAIQGTTTAKTLHLHRRAWNAGENHGRKSTGRRPQENVILHCVSKF